MPKLVENEELYFYLDIDESDDVGGIAPKIRDAVENLLEERTSRSFGPSAVFTDEPYDGSGSRILYVKRPIQTLTSIKFRYGVEALTDYSVDIVNQVVVNGRRIVLKSYTGVDIVAFPCGYDNILVSYTSQAYQPEVAKQAVREVTAAIYRRRGSEDARSEQKGSFHHVLIRGIDDLPSWKHAVESLHIPVIG